MSAGKIRSPCRGYVGGVDGSRNDGMGYGAVNGTGWWRRPGRGEIQSLERCVSVYLLGIDKLFSILCQDEQSNRKMFPVIPCPSWTCVRGIVRWSCDCISSQLCCSCVLCPHWGLRHVYPGASMPDVGTLEDASAGGICPLVARPTGFTGLLTIGSATVARPVRTSARPTCGLAGYPIRLWGEALRVESVAGC